MASVIIRPVQSEDRSWVVSFLKDKWGSDIIVSRGKIHQTSHLDGLIATTDDERAGLLTYACANDEYEIVSLNNIVEGKGVGTKLIQAILKLAADNNYRRVWLITTNDNIGALRFYQKLGFVLSALYSNAIEKSRTIKPEIALVGENGIPIRDEIELEFRLK